MRLFVMPSLREWALVCAFWIVLCLLMYSDRLGPIGNWIDVIAGSRRAFQNTIIAMGAVNVALSVAILGIGIYTDFPIHSLMKWVLLTLFFGFHSTRTMIKIAYKYKIQCESSK
jgi:hypothetical protein